LVARRHEVPYPAGPEERYARALRHFYASTLLDARELIKALADYLGHADPGFTLRTDTHLMPSSEERTRKAIDQAFGYQPPSRPDDGLDASDAGETAA
jgi:integrase